MIDIRAHLSEDALDLAHKAAMPGLFEPMLATLSDTAFSDERWIFERKLDGIRLLVFRDGDYVEMCTRNGQSRVDHFPELVEVFRRQPCRRFVLDGEVVAFEGNHTSFARLQERAGIADPEAAAASGIDIYFYAFDCPWLGGFDLRRVALRDRKRALRQAFDFGGALRYTAYRNADGEAFLAKACDKGWEGILAKRADSAYRRGRSKRWLKLKCTHRQELVIGGFTDPQGTRVGFGALLVGYYENGALRYAGRVGTGFDHPTLARMHRQLVAIERADSPFADTSADAIEEPGVHWVVPERVAEIGYTEWTTEGKLRHPRFLGERDDKPARDVVRERPGA